MQSITSKYIYILFVSTLILGMVLYAPLDLQFIDEIVEFALLALFFTYMFKTKKWEINKVFLFTIAVFVFYVIYSIVISSNSTFAIFYDLTIQIKPYIAFFCIYQMGVAFTSSQKRVLNQMCLIIWFILLPIGLGDLVIHDFISKVMLHPTNYAAAITAVSLTYLYSSNFKWRDKIMFLVMLSIGLVSGRSKFYGFFVLSTVIIFYFSNINNIKLNLKNIMVIVVMVAGIILVAWDKILFYFLGNVVSGEENDYLARFVLYGTSFLIFADYFPFGSGMASFGTHASRVVYSNTYSEYEIDNIWGLSKSYNAFIADTYYPSLAQFGIMGVILFFLFWVYIIKKSYRFFKTQQEARYITLTIIIIGFLLIENVADATQTSNRGFFMMMLLGVMLGQQKTEIESGNMLTNNSEIDNPTPQQA